MLPTAMQGILIPVSNSACKRIFFLARKNRTDFRSTLGNDVVKALMILKSREEIC